jgi:hypothetical protein
MTRWIVPVLLRLSTLPPFGEHSGILENCKNGDAPWPGRIHRDEQEIMKNGGSLPYDLP